MSHDDRRNPNDQDPRGIPDAVENPMNDETTDNALLSGAYALNALSDEERSDFETQLAGSEESRNEVTELSDTAVLLGLAVEPVQPSAGLKASLMAKIALTPQLPAPGAADVAPASAASVTDSSAPASDRPSAVTSAAPVADDSPVVLADRDGGAAFDSILPTTRAEARAVAQAVTPADTKAEGKAEAKAKARWFSRPVAALTAVAAAVALIVSGGVIANQVSTSTFQQQQADALVAINAATDMQQAVAEVAGGGTATLVWSNSLGSSALIVDGLGALPSGKVYELWYINGAGEATPAGTFSATDSGATWRVLDGQMSAGDTVGVTVEPSGGSPTPTTDPIVTIASA